MLYWVSFEAAWILKVVLEAVRIPACQLCGVLNVLDMKHFVATNVTILYNKKSCAHKLSQLNLVILIFLILNTKIPQLLKT